MKKFLFILFLGANLRFFAQENKIQSSILKEPEIVQILEVELKAVKLAPEINLKKAARILDSNKITQDILNTMILMLKNFAGPDNSQVISQEYFSSIINQKLSHQTPISLMYMLAVNKRAIAIHEAAHAVACVYLLPQYNVLTEVTLFGNDSGGAFAQMVSRFASNNQMHEIPFCESMIMMNLAGGVADQIFGLPVRTQWYSVVDWLVGRKKDNSPGLDGLLAEPDIQGDIDYALAYIRYIQKKILQRQDKIEYYQILRNYYEKTREFVITHKFEIEKLANLLVEKGTVFSHEIYELFNMKVPLFDFEQ